MPVSVPRVFGGALATAIAPVATLPTTGAQLALWNGEPQGGKTYNILSVGFTGIASAAAVIIEQLLAHVAPGAQPLINGTAAKGPLPLDGLPPGGSHAQVSGAVTLTAGQAAAGAWHAVGPAINSTANTATIGLGSWANVSGIYSLAPGAILSLAVFCSAAGSATNQIVVTWQEVQV
jgi:hypothetical protein